MEKNITELESIVTNISTKIRAINTVAFNAKPSTNKWSKKEVLGHLIDSAQNNLRRFVVGQYDEDPHIVYDQDFWVKANAYQDMKDEEVIELWRLLNERITSILREMPTENHDRTCNTGKEISSLHSIQWLAEDYVKHLKHHINQIIPGSFEITYP